jgi:hypothetical protein
MMVHLPPLHDFAGRNSFAKPNREWIGSTGGVAVGFGFGRAGMRTRGGSGMLGG